MKIADFQSKLAAFTKARPGTTFTVNDGRFDVSESDFDFAAIANRATVRELIVVTYSRNAFCAVRFERGELVEAWRSPNGQWIGDELGAPDARNLFGNLPTHVAKPQVEIVEGDATNPFQRRDLKQQIADAAATGNLAAAISEGAQ